MSSLIPARFLRMLWRNWPLSRGRSFVWRQVYRRLHGITLARDTFGNQLILDLDNYIDAQIYLGGTFEAEGIRALSDAIDAHGCRAFIDIGANLGAYSLTLARHPQIETVYAFEPDPRNYTQLMANLFLSPVATKVKGFPLALSDHAGESLFYPSRSPTDRDLGKRNSGSSSLRFSDVRHKMDDAVQVTVAPLDSILPLRDQSLALKIDVEGHETAVLHGATELLTNNRCVLLIESFSEQLPQIDTFLGEIGYRRYGPPPAFETHLFEPVR